MDTMAYYEFVVEQKKEGVFLLRKILFLLGYILIGIGWILVGLKTRILAPVLALAPLSIWVLVFLTWKYSCIEYEYSLEAGDLNATIVYGGKKRKSVCRLKIKDCLMIAPETDKTREEASRLKPNEVVSFVSSKKETEVYLLVGDDEDGKRWCLRLEPTAKAISVWHFYNRKTVVSQVRR